MWSNAKFIFLDEYVEKCYHVFVLPQRFGKHLRDGEFRIICSSGSPDPERVKICFFTVARGPVPRDRPRAPVTVVRERPLPNGSGSGDPELQGDEGFDSKTHGEGQALALR